MNLAELNYMAEIANVHPSSLVFMDESGFQKGMRPGYGRAKSSERVFLAEDDASRSVNKTLVMGVRMTGPIAPVLLDGPMNQETFQAWAEQELAPCMREGDVLVMDNLSTHRSKLAKGTLDDLGIRHTFLPPYSPDLNPIELMFSKMKHYVRKAMVTSYDELVKSISNAIDLITKSDISGWFKHSGYPIF